MSADAPTRRPVVRLAMWSGPRNISTALMRAFENRPDTAVVDEPFYGYYLARSGAEHPGRDEVVAAMECDWRKVADALTRQVPAPCDVFYQKHMTHHLLDEVDLTFTESLCNCFLIRDPARIVASYARVLADLTLEDLGLPQQVRIFDYVCERSGTRPPVLDAADVLADPAGTLSRLCARLGIGFDERMLRWPAGRRPTDGVWAPHWYAAVERSTGFLAPPDEPVEVPARYVPIVESARVLYAQLKAD